MTSVDDRLRRAATSLGQDGEPIPPFKGLRQRARRRRMMTGAAVVVVAVAGTFAVAATTRSDHRVNVQQPPPASTTLPSATTTTAAPKPPVTDRSAVSVYLATNEHVVAAGRAVDGAATPEAAVRALLAGPVGVVEEDLGFTSAIPAGTVLHSVSVDGPVATVDLSDIQAEPVISTLDNRPADILVGEEVPLRVVDYSSVGVAGQAPRATVCFRETGIRLTVTPHVTANRQILMNLRTERSAVVPLAARPDR